MNKYPCGKAVIALVVAITVAAGARLVAQTVVHAEPPHEVTTETTSSKAPTHAAVAEAAAQVPAGVAVVSFGALLAKADPAAGQKTARVCAACHSFGKSEAAKMGPNLYGVVGGPHAHMAGFAYSDAMKSMREHKWDFDELNEFIHDPRGHLPGTKMTFAGLKNDQDRANVIAWLNTHADKPLPLPKK